jgi:hypothetical protein
LAVIHVTVRREGLTLRTPGGEAGGAQAAAGLMAALDRVPQGAPVAALIHGFRFEPGRGCHDPHDTLFCARNPRAWPARLGFSPQGRQDGLCIAFGWEARASGTRLFSWPRATGTKNAPQIGIKAMTADLSNGAASIAAGAPMARRVITAALRAAAWRLVPDLGFAQVYERAAEAGRCLGALIEVIHEARPDLTVDMLAHSLGARAALHALSAPGAGRAILLGAAEHAVTARRLLPRDRPGGAEVINIIARHNDLFDAMFEAAAPTPMHGRPGALGRAGLGARAGNWIDLQIDNPAHEAFLAGRGLMLGAAPGPICHRGFYQREGSMRLWSTMLRDRARWSPEALRRSGAPTDLHPRWSRLAGASAPQAHDGGAMDAPA